MRRGEKVVHNLIVMEAQRKWIGGYLLWLSKRRYPTTFPNHPHHMAPVIIREIRAYDFSVPKGSVANLMGELAPYNVPDSFLGKKFGFFSKSTRFLLGLDKPYPSIGSSVEAEPLRNCPFLFRI